MTNRKFIVYLLSLMLVAASFGVFAPAALGAMQGAGTEDNPYIVMTAQDLDDVRKNVSASYKLGADIDLSKFDAGDGKGWKAIGDNDNRFSGTFDGNGHVVRGMKIDRPDDDFAALFGYVSSGHVKNIGVENATVVGKNYSGTVVGYLGGTEPSLHNSYAIGGSVTGAKYVGGLLGRFAKGELSNSFAQVDTTGNDYVGSVTGRGDAAQSSFVYGTGKVTVLETDVVGGLQGADPLPNTMSNSYWDMDTTGQQKSVGGTGKSTADMKKKATYAGWDFNNTWQIEEGKGYPTLKMFASAAVPAPASPATPAASAPAASEKAPSTSAPAASAPSALPKTGAGGASDNYVMTIALSTVAFVLLLGTATLYRRKNNA